MATLIIGIVAALLAALIVLRTVRIVPQARAGNVERLGRYIRTLEPGLNFVIPFVDRVRPLIDVREQVVSFEPRAVITEDNLSVHIDTVLYFQVTNPRDAAYEIANYIQAIEQLTVTTLRNVIGSLDLEKVLVSREYINSTLRGVLDEASGKWGIRVNRVELKGIDPPPTIKEAMEKQMRADREKRATILAAEGIRQSRILTAEGERQAAILKAEGQAKAIDTVFGAIHRNDPDPKLLAYQYLQVLPELAKGQGNTFWVIPSEVTSALQSVTRAFTENKGATEDEADEPPVPHPMIKRS
ncbi:SPFH domain-containing protein [Microlunatus sp. Gsoil 973]|uniref:SPFH domain-containing protein n=1 Tax=Microlunatus sp. Gsoil 973 TaxID=2672569 RepID=UPI0012B4DDA8|nr:SPFH domain-containing protein [Microlunatus sp. Gsoil 973]QGN32926.1 SPFH/Band 7/PHB domain protein [Microlunatus sp. Gsoil 973]